MSSHLPATAEPAALRPVLVLGLGGASFDVIEPMIERGELPTLGRWRAEGRAGRLGSTLPAVTFPAWSTFATGLDPGEHGLFDFTQKLAGRYRLRFSNASDRHGESIFGAVNRAGGRVLVLGLPASYPPEPLRGLLVPGFDAPVATGSQASSTSDPALYERIARRAGPWMRPDLDESGGDPRFHERALDTLLSRVERKTDFALQAMAQLAGDAGGARPDLAVVIFSESDTVGHHYWRDHDPASPRHDPTASADRRGAIETVYRALDRACARLRAAYGEDALCIVMSDHGMGGASRRVVQLNRYLAKCGLLARRRVRGLDRAARAARDAALRQLPAALVQALFRRARRAAARLESSARFGGFDWSRTLAFSEEANTQPGVWINLAGREARGCVAQGDYERVRDRVIAALQSWRLPEGGPVVARALRREDVYCGPFTDRAPDVVVELALDRGYGLSLVATRWSEDEDAPAVRELAEAEWGGGRGRGMNGTHRQQGIFIATGRGASREHACALAPASLADLAPLIAREMGFDWSPSGVDGPRERQPYSREEDARVAARLRALGYLE